MPTTVLKTAKIHLLASALSLTSLFYAFQSLAQSNLDKRTLVLIVLLVTPLIAKLFIHAYTQQVMGILCSCDESIVRHYKHLKIVASFYLQFFQKTMSYDQGQQRLMYFLLIHYCRQQLRHEPEGRRLSYLKSWSGEEESHR